MRIAYWMAEQASEANLRRWLAWAIKGDPSEERVMKGRLSTKEDVLCALTWIGAIQSDMLHSSR